MTTSQEMVDLLGRGPRPEQVRHVREIPERQATHAPWPAWLHPDVVAAYERLGIHEPYAHQVAALDAPRHAIVATGTASGKSLVYQSLVLDAVHRGKLAVAQRPGMLHHPDEATALYISPTKALAADQLSSLRSLRFEDVRTATYDGDTDPSERRWIREHADVILCNPDMLHHAILPHHAGWSRFFRRLRYVIVDEAHSYRGVFGSHVAVLLRRLTRIAAHFGASPTFIGASATSASPQESFAKLIGADPADVTAVEQDTSPRGSRTVVLWEPEQSPGGSDNGAPRRRTVTAEASDMLTDLVLRQIRTIAFIRSRRGAETIAQNARRQLEEVDASLGHRVAAYRSGFLPEERRELEQQLRDGRLLAVASTSALELGIDIAGLDAVLVAGWPGTRASFLQQIGRAGRSGQRALAALIAADDPLDGYLVNHPEAIFDVPVEATVFEASNPYVLAPHLCAAAAELPLRPDELARFGPTAHDVVDSLTNAGHLRRRPSGWFWTRSEQPAAMVSIRSGDGGPVQIIDTDTGSVLGTMGAPQSHYQAHPGAVYVHQGRTYLVDELDEELNVAAVRRAFPDFYTVARDVTEVRVRSVADTVSWGPVTIHRGEVDVTTQVVSYQRKLTASNEVAGEEPLELPPRQLSTVATWFTVSGAQLASMGIEEPEIPGALHAAEHAMIGLLPLLASCDRWDVGGLSTALHVDTELPTIFVHDGHPGGAGFAERGYDMFRRWITATRDAVAQCECESGCPSCVQSPKCGNRNNPLDKAGALKLLNGVLRFAPTEEPPREGPAD
ncbi:MULTISPECIES: DEAD/DEAH box helicase [Kocuria]|uniref:DEAD/DEAH box helicase n=1 Tax=Kocuria salsicia TaxID=664639 RepID=A0ABV3KB27_9MICC|nr:MULTISPECIES: DEAD/DEAH box helicase [Kocuria]